MSSTTRPTPDVLHDRGWMEQSSWAYGEDTASRLSREVEGGGSCRSINGNTPPGDEPVRDDTDVWWNIDLCDEEGDGGNAPAAMEVDRQTFSLSPLTVGPSLLPRARSMDVHAVLFPSTAGVRSPTKLSPLKVKAPASSCRRSACGVIRNDLNGSAAIPLPSSSTSDSGPVMEQSDPCSSGGCSAGGDAAGEGGGFGGAPMPPCGVGWGARAAAAAAAAAGPATDETRKATNKREKEPSPPQPKRVVGRVSVETLREELDFEGRTAQLTKPNESPFAEAFCMPCSDDEGHDQDREQYLVFTGLEEAGQPLQTLTARVNFSVNAERKTQRVVGELQARKPAFQRLFWAGPNGRVYGAVQCPSMKELWPEVYSAAAVRVVQVDLRVEIRSRSGDFLHLDSELKVIYRRPQDNGSSEGASWRP
ncbi:unnamed protein product [Ectocarpus sp. 6 AP-2014]